ncbi:MAG: DegT/DnrJ/EryC1/StrS family aminotransferase [Acidimicrobiaceae bacterium]|nr:DegT/DnrJ/EryC1/StrS family aminotransferase [Acidimicrobiaceae bacterium]
MKLPVSGAVHDERESEAVVAVLRSSTLDIGESVFEFERRTASLLSKQHGIMVNAVSLPVHHGLNADHIGFMCEQLDAVLGS